MYRKFQKGKEGKVLIHFMFDDVIVCGQNTLFCDP